MNDDADDANWRNEWNMDEWKSSYDIWDDFWSMKSILDSKLSCYRVKLFFIFREEKNNGGKNIKGTLGFLWIINFVRFQLIWFLVTCTKYELWIHI